MAKGLIISDNDESISGQAIDALAQKEEFISKAVSGDILQAAEVIRALGYKTSPLLAKLETSVKDAQDNYMQARKDANAVYSNLSDGNKKRLQELQNVSGKKGMAAKAGTYIKAVPLLTSGIIGAGKNINKITKQFEKTSKELDKVLDGDKTWTGIRLNQDNGRVEYKIPVVESKQEQSAAQTPAKTEEQRLTAGQTLEKFLNPARGIVSTDDVIEFIKLAAEAKTAADYEVLGEKAGLTPEEIGRLDAQALRGLEAANVSQFIKNCVVQSLVALDKLPTIVDLANAVAKVFIIDEKQKAEVGHLKIVEGSELGNVIQFTKNVQEPYEYLLAAGEDADNAMKVSDFIKQSGYEPVEVVSVQKVKEALKQVAVYTDKEGKTLLMIPKERAAELEEAGAVKSRDVMISENRTKEALEMIKAKFEGAEAKVVVDKLLEKVINGYMSAEEIDRMVLVALVEFASVGEIEEYLGLKGKREYSKEEIGEAAVNKIGEAIAVSLEGGEGLSVEEVEKRENERDMEISLIRVAADIVMAAKEDEKIKGMINEIKDEQGVRELQALMPREIKVNRYVVAEAMANKTSIDENVMTMGEFKIDITKIKTSMEEKAPKFNMFNKKNEDLMKMIAGGMRGKTASFSPMLRNARAVAAAA
jgi:hypothetical protein